MPEELGDLVQLVRLDLSGLPYLHDWLRDPAARRRHKLGPSRDSSRVTLQVSHTARCPGGIFAEFKLPQSSSGSARFSCPRFAVLVHGFLLPADGSGVFGLRRGSPDPRHHVWSGERQPAAPNYPSYREMGCLEYHKSGRFKSRPCSKITSARMLLLLCSAGGGPVPVPSLRWAQVGGGGPGARALPDHRGGVRPRLHANAGARLVVWMAASCAREA